MDETTDVWTVEVQADTRPLQLELARMETLGERFGRAMTNSFQGIATGSKSAGEALRGLALQLSSLVVRAAFRPFEQAVGNLAQQVFSSFTPFAKGGVVERGSVVPFASGGVVAAPTYFPLAGSRTGLMGERGAEAILPLARGPDGRLGVRSDAAGGVVVVVTMNISTPDAEGFRRSEAQVAALLSRAVSQGRRNL